VTKYEFQRLAVKTGEAEKEDRLINSTGQIKSTVQFPFAQQARPIVNKSFIADEGGKTRSRKIGMERGKYISPGEI